MVGAVSATDDDPLPPLFPAFQCLPDGAETGFTSLSSNAPGIETSTHPIAASNRSPRLVTVSWTVTSLFAGKTSGDAVIVQRETAATGAGRGSSTATASKAAPARREPRRAIRRRGAPAATVGSARSCRGGGASATCSMPSMNAATRRSSSWLPAASPRRRSASVTVERLAIRAGRRHRREGVADGEDPGDQRDVLAGEAGRGSRRRPSARGGGGCRLARSRCRGEVADDRRRRGRRAA